VIKILIGQESSLAEPDPGLGFRQHFDRHSKRLVKVPNEIEYGESLSQMAFEPSS
jgi:hypothetical protein